VAIAVTGFCFQRVGCSTAITNVTTGELEELVNKSGFVKPLSVYDKKLGFLVDELCKAPHWFTSLHKLISGQTSSSTLSVRCRIYISNDSEHQYLVVLPSWFEDVEINAFVIVDNGAVPTESIVAAALDGTSSDRSLMNVVFKRNVYGSEEVNTLVETVSKAMCYNLWRAVAAVPVPSTSRPFTSSRTFTPFLY